MVRRRPSFYGPTESPVPRVSAVEVRIAPLLAFVLILGGIAAHIEANIHAPVVLPRALEALQRDTGWSTTALDTLRLGGWALIVSGLIIVLVVHVRDKSIAPDASHAIGGSCCQGSDPDPRANWRSFTQRISPGYLPPRVMTVDE